jgi:dTDP-4-dehydrorhamnose reductase
MHAHLVAWGVAPAELAWLVQNRCPPDMIGIDHYVTSDRFLDEDLHRYPRCYWGGNARQRYADVEAVRVRQQPGTSRRAIILEAAQRYGLPVALTEVHIGCTPDEQVRWLHEAWTTCRSLERTGVDVRAMTAWAILGSYDWDSLLTRDRGRFEAGVFELTDVGPRATSVSEFVAGLAAGRDHRAASIVATPGWWRRPERMLYGLEPEPSMTLVSA